MGNSRGIALNHRQAIVLSSEPLKLPSCPGLFSNLWRGVGLQVEGTFPLSQLLPRGKVLSSFLPLLVFFFFFSFVLPQYVEIFLAMLNVWDVLPVFSRYSVRIVPQVIAFSIYCGRKWASCPIPPFWFIPLNETLSIFSWIQIVSVLSDTS